MLSPLGVTPALRAASWMVSTGMRKLKPWTTCSPWSEVNVAAPMTCLPAIVEARSAAIALDDGGVGLEHALSADVLLETRDAAGRDRGLVLRAATEQLVGNDDAGIADHEERLAQVQIGAVPGQTDDGQLLVLDLQDSYVAPQPRRGGRRSVRLLDRVAPSRGVHPHLVPGRLERRLPSARAGDDEEPGRPGLPDHAGPPRDSRAAQGADTPMRACPGADHPAGLPSKWPADPLVSALVEGGVQKGRPPGAALPRSATQRRAKLGARQRAAIGGHEAHRPPDGEHLSALCDRGGGRPQGGGREAI